MTGDRACITFFLVCICCDRGSLLHRSLPLLSASSICLFYLPLLSASSICLFYLPLLSASSMCLGNVEYHPFPLLDIHCPSRCAPRWRDALECLMTLSNTCSSLVRRAFLHRSILFSFVAPFPAGCFSIIWIIVCSS